MKELTRCNIDRWHLAGYRGKNVVIGLLEANEVDSHGGKVQHVLQQIAPEATVLKQKPYNLISLRATTANLINVSLDVGEKKLRTEYELEAIDRGITIVHCTGNTRANGKPHVSANAAQDHAISVGALHSDSKDSFTRAHYSLYDEKHPTTMGIANVFPYQGRALIGTSVATPWVVGMLALWFQWHDEKMGRYPSHWEAKTFVIKHSKALGIQGTGAGLFILPDSDQLEK